MRGDFFVIYFGENICGDFTKATEKEWLETNGLGGYASSTIINVNTRGYHGLLVSALKPPLQRVLTLSKVEDTIIFNGKRYELSCNQYQNAIYPEGHKYLSSFRIDQYPTFRYKVENLFIEKSIFMAYGKNTVFIVYRLIDAPSPVVIELRPLIACRDFHARMHEWLNPNINAQYGIDSISVDMINIKLSLLLNGGKFDYQPYWYRNFEYAIEAQRCQEAYEDLYSPGYFTRELNLGDEFALIASTDDQYAFDLESIRSQEISRRVTLTENKLLESLPSNFRNCVSCLLVSADQFIVNQDDHPSIIAGYHWFGDWGRDTMISLPGLTLVTGRHDIAKSILENYAKYCDQGMIPNCFAESDGQPLYNSVDASLWFIYAIKKYLDYTDDLTFIELGLFDTIKNIIRYYREGTRYNIHADKDGLIYAGDKGTQLTWMDAKVGEIVATPRYGKAVEVNALWYNALMTVSDIYKRLGDDSFAERYLDLSNEVKESFNKLFWNEKAKCLYDCVYDDHFDDSIRPNQIFAISLPYQLIDGKKAESVLNVVHRELLTPFGLRSLSPKDKKYKSQYVGDQYSRDMAYHQGTVWAWLLGHFITAYVKVNGDNEETTVFIKTVFDIFIHEHLDDAGVGTVSEIFDGDSPHHPRGCISQAWSVAERLRSFFEYNFNSQKD
ncbi:MAG: amylo-alpha-1,6-glucosidase [Candidatus Poribacteria bacterium]